MDKITLEVRGVNREYEIIDRQAPGDNLRAEGVREIAVARGKRGAHKLVYFIGAKMVPVVVYG